MNMDPSIHTLTVNLTIGLCFLQGLTLAGVVYCVRVISAMSRVLDQHRLLWYDYAKAHGLPVAGDLRPANGEALKAMRAGVGVLLLACMCAASLRGQTTVIVGNSSAKPANVATTMAQPARITGSITSSTSAISAAVSGYSVATVTVHGTYAGVTISFLFSDDGGTTWYVDTCTRTDTNVQETGEALPSNQTRAWDCGIYAATNFEVLASAWTSGAASIGITMSAAPIEPALTVGLASGVPSGSNTIGNVNQTAATAGYNKVTDGTNVQAVKGASTAAAVADPAAVMALSPNTPVPSGTNTIGNVNDQGAEMPGYAPTPAVNVGPSTPAPISLDASGQVMTRGLVLTDEGSFRDDFSYCVDEYDANGHLHLCGRVNGSRRYRHIVLVPARRHQVRQAFQRSGGRLDPGEQRAVGDGRGADVGIRWQQHDGRLPVHLLAHRDRGNWHKLFDRLLTA